MHSASRTAEQVDQYLYTDEVRWGGAMRWIGGGEIGRVHFCSTGDAPNRIRKAIIHTAPRDADGTARTYTSA